MDAPRDARAIAAILKGMNVNNYEVDVVHMLLEVMHSHIGDVLLAARGVADHAGKCEIELDDLHLAAETQRAPCEPPPRDAVLTLARERNATALPPTEWLQSDCDGIPLPSQQHLLTSQRDIVIELPPKRDPRATEPEGPWVQSSEEQLVLLEQQTSRRKRMAEIGEAAVSDMRTMKEPSSTPLETTAPVENAEIARNNDEASVVSHGTS